MYSGQKWEKFHLKLDKELYKKLLDEAKYWDTTVSLIIDKILKKSYMAFEKVEFTVRRIDRKDFKEENLDMNVDIKISIGEKFKNRLFNFQDHFRLRSKAAILRFVIRKYFDKLKWWCRREKRVRGDVYGRWVHRWEILKILKVRSNGGYWQKDWVHMNLSDQPTTHYIYNKLNALHLIIHKIP